LKDEQQLNSSEVETQCEQLTKEVEELCRSLHEAQENEVSYNEELYASREERDNLQRENEQLVHELAQRRVRCEDVTSELTRVVESTELARHRFVEAERVEWEAREVRLVAELEAARAPRSDYFHLSTVRSLNIRPVLSTINLFRFSFFINSSFLWNAIPFEIFKINRTNPFRSALRHSLF